MNVYKSCPILENERYRLRLSIKEDAKDLLKTYSDPNAVPFFNADNCHGDDFYYTTIERMSQAIDFWICAYNNGWFVRWTIIDKQEEIAVGTIEAFRRESNDYFTDCCLLRLDLHSSYENCDDIAEILSLIVSPSIQIFGCDKVATKAKHIATERRKALEKLNFVLSDKKLIGDDGTEYGDYYILKSNPRGGN